MVMLPDAPYNTTKIILFSYCKRNQQENIYILKLPTRISHFVTFLTLLFIKSAVNRV